VESSSHSGFRALAAAVALAAGLSVAACSGNGTAGTAARGGPNDASALQNEYESVVDSVLPSVVQIATKTGTGSGVVFDSKGYVVTNAHVVGNDKTVDLRPATGDTVLTGDVIGKFVPDDLAVVRVTKDASMLKPAKFANSDDAQIGEIVLTMGNPLGLTDSVAQGIVSATGRTVGEPGGAVIPDAIQTTAAINPGNSGGALVTMQDQVIGIPTLSARLPNEAGSAPGIGFAIPSNTVKDIAGQLIAHGRVTDSGRASLQITADTVADTKGDPAGVGVTAVTAGGAAASAGIRPGDVITAVAGTSTPSLGVLESVLATLKPGDRVPVTVVRNGASSTVHVTLGTLTG
jgi:putative serine protease PepD